MADGGQPGQEAWAAQICFMFSQDSYLHVDDNHHRNYGEDYYDCVRIALLNVDTVF